MDIGYEKVVALCGALLILWSIGVCYFTSKNRYLIEE
jgi:hypothetical protein